jgi:hypothetical protein
VAGEGDCETTTTGAGRKKKPPTGDLLASERLEGRGRTHDC